MAIRADGPNSYNKLVNQQDFNEVQTPAFDLHCSREINFYEFLAIGLFLIVLRSELQVHGANCYHTRFSCLLKVMATKTDMISGIKQLAAVRSVSLLKTKNVRLRRRPVTKNYSKPRYRWQVQVLLQDDQASTWDTRKTDRSKLTFSFGILCESAAAA